MKLTTSSGTVYLLKNIIKPEDQEGPLKLYTADLSRVSGRPMRNIGMGADFIEETNDWNNVIYTEEPLIGRAFIYIHPLWSHCISTAIIKIEED